jgi:arginyl-tRNA synthetase
MKSEIRALLDESLPELARVLQASVPEGFDYDVEIPKTKGHGDLATNLAMKLARHVRRNPVEIADLLKNTLERSAASRPFLSRGIKNIAVEKPGFVNFFLEASSVMPVLLDVHGQKNRYGASDYGKGKRVLLEYVSANPTGPLTIAHGRQASIGDALGRILAATGHAVSREYYLNDTGRQMNILGLSAWLRYRESCGEKIQFPEEGYQGDYVRDIAQEVKKEVGDRYLRAREDEAVLFFSEYAGRVILEGIREDLSRLGVSFDRYYGEKELRKTGRIEAVIDTLRKKDLAFEKEGALWFRSTRFGDDKDRVMRKSTGEYTYLAPDIAYHQDKFARGFDFVVNLWGPDHHGYVPRIAAACEALGISRDRLRVLIVQLTTLYRHGEPVRMSTRAGSFVTLRELMDEVGVDATRFFFILRKVESLLDFDLELAKQKSEENPVYYLQYAHARISSILAFAGLPVTRDADLAILSQAEEFELAKRLGYFPEVLIQAARSLEPYRVVEYLRDLAAAFHKYYTLHRVVSEEKELTKARLLLAEGVRTVLANGLGLLGVSAPEKM